MRSLLDTCTFLWLITDAKELSEKARTLFLDTSNQVFLSAISSWEISLKYSINKLDLPREPSLFVPEQRMAHGIQQLDLDEDSALHFFRVPAMHRDPFDRMLVSQAVIHGMTILSPDREISQYNVRVIW